VEQRLSGRHEFTKYDGSTPLEPAIVWQLGSMLKAVKSKECANKVEKWWTPGLAPWLNAQVSIPLLPEFEHRLREKEQRLHCGDPGDEAVFTAPHLLGHLTTAEFSKNTKGQLFPAFRVRSSAFGSSRRTDGGGRCVRDPVCGRAMLVLPFQRLMQFKNVDKHADHLVLCAVLETGLLVSRDSDSCVRCFCAL
jgi:hypothetical protein